MIRFLKIWFCEVLPIVALLYGVGFGIAYWLYSASKTSQLMFFVAASAIVLSGVITWILSLDKSSGSFKSQSDQKTSD